MQGVFVLGMHRSGTSAAARLVNFLGIPTCVDEDLLPTTEDNPKGFWESASLAALNDLTEGDGTAGMTHLAVSVLFMLMELLPVLFGILAFVGAKMIVQQAFDFHI